LPVHQLGLLADVKEPTENVTGSITLEGAFLNQSGRLCSDKAMIETA
jgi:hypothetical protein